MLVITVTYLADMKKSMIAMKPTMYRYNPRLLFMREQIPSAACNPETAPMQHVRTDPASRTKWPIQYPTVTALLRAAMSGRVVVCMLKRPTWKCLVPFSSSYRSAGFSQFHLMTIFFSLAHLFVFVPHLLS